PIEPDREVLPGHEPGPFVSLLARDLVGPDLEDRQRGLEVDAFDEGGVVLEQLGHGRCEHRTLWRGRAPEIEPPARDRYGAVSGPSARSGRGSHPQPRVGPIPGEEPGPSVPG